MSDSFIKSPIHINTHRTISNMHKNTQASNLSTKYYGEYEEYKLNNLMIGSEDSLIHWDNTGKIVNMVNMREDMKVEMSEDFLEVMERYIENDVVFVVVMGERKSGKSFFCDKILNLA